VTKATVNTSGLVTAVAAGTPGITAVINGGPSSASYSITITNPSVALTGVSLSTAGGVTGLFVGSTNQLKATCTYSDGSSDDCTATDAHGNTAGSYTSSSSAHATVGASTGLVSGIAAGTTNLSATAGSFSSPNLPLTVLAVPTGIYTITIKGPVTFSGTVHF
jgi:trimeric autotransporter adhesin